MSNQIDIAEQSKKEISTDEKEKAKFLYEYSKARFETELERFKSTEDKSAKFMTLLSIIIAGHTALVINSVKYLLNINNLTSTLCLVFMLLTSAALFTSWYFIFKSLTLKAVPRLTLDQNMINYIKHFDLSTTYNTLSENCLDGLNASKETTNLKQVDLEKGYNDIGLSVVFLVISLLLLLLTQLNQP